jgi:hypothetical protein
VWHAFLRDYTDGKPIADFKEPKNIVRATIDRWSGGDPGPWTRGTVKEYFIAGTQPDAKNAVDEDGLLYDRGCGGWVVDPVKAELGPERWDDDVANWHARARHGVGTRGPLGSTIAYWYGASSWGGPLAGPCPQPKPQPTDNGNGNGTGNGNGHGPKPTKPPPPPPDATAAP